jgi:hypothetical protein
MGLGCAAFLWFKIFFVDFDYVGAPWDNGVVGNGGLSIRKKSKMLEIINMYQKDNNNKNKKDLSHEDVFFSLNPYVSLFKPTFNQAKLFSMEKVFSEKGSFGIHNAWNYIDNQLLQTHCDEISILKSLQEPHFNIL